MKSWYPYVLGALLAGFSCSKSGTPSPQPEHNDSATKNTDTGAAKRVSPSMSQNNDCILSQQDSMLSHLPGFEQGVVFQSLSADREGQLSGFRVFADGRYERMKLDSPWQPVKTLPAEQVEALRNAIADANLASVHGVHKPQRLPDDATYSIFQTGPETSQAVVAYSPCRVERIDRLFERIVALL
jgi:hypothetical protein